MTKVNQFWRAFEYFFNCSDHEGMPKITKSMFGLTGMNVAKVKKTSPRLKVSLSAVEASAADLKKD